MPIQPRENQKMMLDIVRCRVNSRCLISEEHKTQGTGGSEAPLNLWSDPQLCESN